MACRTYNYCFVSAKALNPSLFESGHELLANGTNLETKMAFPYYLSSLRNLFLLKPDFCFLNHFTHNQLSLLREKIPCSCRRSSCSEPKWIGYLECYEASGRMRRLRSQLCGCLFLRGRRIISLVLPEQKSDNEVPSLLVTCFI